MPRQKEYDRDVAVTRAMEVFWRQGYEGTSMQDLVDATGLNRFSIYNGFGNKEGLFNEALDRYRDEIVGRLMAHLEKKPAGLVNIESFFHAIVEYNSQPGGKAGCLFTNTAVDMPMRESAAAERVTRHIERLERAFRRCLVAAEKAGEIGPMAGTRAAARMLVAVVLGAGVLGRVTSDPKLFEQIAGMALASIRGATARSHR